MQPIRRNVKDSGLSFSILNPFEAGSPPPLTAVTSKFDFMRPPVVAVYNGKVGGKGR